MKALVNFTFMAVIAFYLPVSVAQQVDGPKIQVLNFSDFKLLSEKSQAAYLRGLREAMLEIEKSQKQMGMRYEYASLEKAGPWWTAWLSRADAQTKVGPGETCVYAGYFTTYSSRSKLSCTNTADLRCEGKARQIKCNPLLFGDGLCTDARDGATARCMRMKRPSDQEIAATIANNYEQQWNQFASTFNSFCGGVFKSTRDINYNSCKLIEKRMNDLRDKVQAELDKKKKPVAPPPAPVQPAAPTVMEGACSSPPGSKAEPNSGSCMKCPERPAYTVDVPNTEAEGRYSELIEIMAQTCKVENKSDSGSGPTGVSAKSKSDIIKKLGICEAKELETQTPWEKEFVDAESASLLALLRSGDSSAHREMSSGLWENKFSRALQDRFGIGIKDARQAFCSNGSAADAVSVLKKYPEFTFMYGTGLSIHLPEVLKDKDQVKTMPIWFHEAELGRWDGKDKLTALNRFKLQTLRRQKIAECLEKNVSEPARHTKKKTEQGQLKCALDVYEVNSPEQYTLTFNKIVEQRGGGTICVDRPSGGGGACTCEKKNNRYECSCPDKNNPSQSIAPGPAKLTVLRCQDPYADGCPQPSGRCARPQPSATSAQ